MDEPLDEKYFKWLYCQVGDPGLKNPSRTYWRMMKALFTREFVWLIPNDDNRLEDGKDLRYEFVDDVALKDVALEWIKVGCSMLELLIALSRRLAFEAEGERRDWFWQLIENLGLREYNDRKRFTEEEVYHILDKVIWRQYEPNGSGGLFPLKHTTRDQRQVELWYQLSEYVIEEAA